HIQTISNYLKELAVSFGAAPSSITVIPNGINIRAFQNPDPILREDIKSTFGVTRDDRVIFTASRLVHKNAVDVIIKSMQLLPRHAKLVIAGEGEDEQKLKALARALGVSDRVHFAGMVPNDQIPAYFAIAHVFARPSRSEGLGVAFLEAMAAGVPVVATEVGGIVDFLRDGETGLAVGVNNPSDVAKKIELLLADEPLRQKLIANGRRLVEEKYQWSKIAAQMANIFEGLLIGII
ncbi:MAG: glycosyltransferase family 4 protein, partial [Patescibacteria group bacterium]